MWLVTGSLDVHIHFIEKTYLIAYLPKQAGTENE